MNLQTMSKSIGSILYEKGVFGHVTVDLISFPDPTGNSVHPLFYAIDLNCYLTDYAASVYSFDLLMEGWMDKLTGQYYVEIQNEGEDENSKNEEGVFDNTLFEPWCYMFTKFLHHPGLA